MVDRRLNRGKINKAKGSAQPRHSSGRLTRHLQWVLLAELGFEERWWPFTGAR